MSRMGSGSPRGRHEENAPVLQAPLYLADNGKRPRTKRNRTQSAGRLATASSASMTVKSQYDGFGHCGRIGGENKSHKILLERTNQSGTSVKYVSRVTPQVLDETGHARFGVGPYETALVQEVIPDSPAALSGLREGDIIQEVDGKPVTLPAFIKYVEDTGENQEISIQIQRRPTAHHKGDSQNNRQN